jgi:hypothetical protein
MVLDMITPPVELVGVALVAATFALWWWMTLPLARVQQAERRFAEDRRRARQAPSWSEDRPYKPEIYRARPYRSSFFPGTVPYTATLVGAEDTSRAAQVHPSRDNFAMPAFARAPQP